MVGSQSACSPSVAGRRIGCGLATLEGRALLAADRRPEQAARMDGHDEGEAKMGRTLTGTMQATGWQGWHDSLKAFF